MVDATWTIQVKCVVKSRRQPYYVIRHVCLVLKPNTTGLDIADTFALPKAPDSTECLKVYCMFRKLFLAFQLHAFTPTFPTHNPRGF